MERVSWWDFGWLTGQVDVSRWFEESNILLSQPQEVKKKEHGGTCITTATGVKFHVVRPKNVPFFFNISQNKWEAVRQGHCVESSETTRRKKIKTASLDRICGHGQCGRLCMCVCCPQASKAVSPRNELVHAWTDMKGRKLDWACLYAHTQTIEERLFACGVWKWWTECTSLPLRRKSFFFFKCVYTYFIKSYIKGKAALLFWPISKCYHNAALWQ